MGSNSQLVWTMKQFCILQLPIAHSVSLIMVTTTRYKFTIIFQKKHLSAVKFTIEVRTRAVLQPRVSPAFAITYLCNHCNIRFDPIPVKMKCANLLGLGILGICAPGTQLIFRAGLGIPESWYFRLKSVKTGVLPCPFHQNILTCNSPC